MHKHLSPIPLQPYAAWLVGLGLAWPASWLFLTWLGRAEVKGLGWLLLSLAVIGTGLVIYLYQRRRQQPASCNLKPQVGPLQVSCLAAQVLGVQWLWYAQSPEFAATFPFLAWPGWPYIFIIGGVAGLGWLSLFCNCRDEALLERR